MAQPWTPVEVARAFTTAWARHDLDTAATFLAEDVTFVGPNSRSHGKHGYLVGLARFAEQVTAGPRIHAAFGDGDSALIMYDVTTAVGVVTYAELLTIRGGTIRAARLTFSASVQ